MLYFMKQLDMLPSDTDGVIDKCNKAIEKMNGKTVYFDILTMKQTLNEDQSKLEKLKSDIDKKIQKMQNPEKYEDKNDTDHGCLSRHQQGDRRPFCRRRLLART